MLQLIIINWKYFVKFTIFFLSENFRFRSIFNSTGQTRNPQFLIRPRNFPSLHPITRYLNEVDQDLTKLHRGKQGGEKPRWIVVISSIDNYKGKVKIIRIAVGSSNGSRISLSVRGAINRAFTRSSSAELCRFSHRVAFTDASVADPFGRERERGREGVREREGEGEKEREWEGKEREREALRLFFFLPSLFFSVDVTGKRRCARARTRIPCVPWPIWLQERPHRCNCRANVTDAGSDDSRRELESLPDLLEPIYKSHPPPLPLSRDVCFTGVAFFFVFF